MTANQHQSAEGGARPADGAGAVLRQIIPAAVAVAEVFDGSFDQCPLFPEEEAALARAAPNRRREFTGGRECARRALAAAGFPPAPLVPGPSGAPTWPAGVVGSLTHCAGYRGCAVGRAGEFAAIGIDAEPHRPLPEGVLPMVAGEPERTALAGLAAAAPGTCWDKVLFSAKESVYKAWFPVTGRWLGFADATVDLEPGGRFTARLRVPGPVVGDAAVAAYHGRWIVRRGLIVTAVVLPHP